MNYFKSYSSLGDDRFFCVTLYLIVRVKISIQKYRCLIE